MTDLFLGIDLGGTNVKLGVCTAEGDVRGEETLPTEPARGPEDTVRRVVEAAGKLMASAGRARACGSGAPGPLDVDRRTILKAVNMPGWIDVPYPRLLGDALAIPTVMENDANCAAWGEFKAGAGRGTRSMVLYTLGTGVGGGIVIDGKLWTGASGAGGELGHVSVDPAGPRCDCGQVGCVEKYASATALVERHGGGTAPEIFDAARHGDARALAAVDWSAEGLAIGLANVTHVLHPEVIVLAGGMAAAGDLLLDRVREGVRKRVFSEFMKHLRIEPSVLGDRAGWLGAALWGARRAGAAIIREPTAASR